ncbi:MAG TPA: DUF559 domain-containing protein [Rhizomicrobium sp.]
MVKDETQKHREAKAHLRGFARRMRSEPTEAERFFWQVARGAKIDGLKFKRQVPIGNYIADFVCLEHRVIVEIDGAPHEMKKQYDADRDAFLAAQGFQVLRFENYQITSDIDSVLEIIKRTIALPRPR